MLLELYFSRRRSTTYSAYLEKPRLLSNRLPRP
ncbi:hypothetical protein Vi05172_g3686 [Venturia inaequalis]|nr:hypothetical protein Vi05172_g3686 [Venturia inaequalis]